MAKAKKVKPETKVVEKEVAKEIEVKEVAEVKVEKVVQLTNEDLILIINNTAHELIYVNPTSGEQFTINGYGSEYEITFRELKAMKNQQPAFIEKEWIIIADEQAVKQLGLENYYANKLMPKMVVNMLENDFGKLKETLVNAKVQTKESFIKIITEKIEKRQFNDYSKILDLQNILGVNLIN